jgi:hypothetical protein
MSHEAATPRVRLNDDVWRHTAAILGDAKALCALEVSRELLALVRKDEAAWRVALDSLASPVLAAAFVKAAPGARNLCRGWLQRWRAQPWHPESDWDPTLCVPWGGDYSGPFTESAPRVVFEVSDDTRDIIDRDHFAGVMEWNGTLATGQQDDDKSLVFKDFSSARCWYSGAWIESHGAIGDQYPGITTSCYVVDEQTGAMIELWRDAIEFDNFGTILGKRATMAHGCLELLCLSQNENAALPVMHEIRSPPQTTTHAPAGVDLMTLYGYVRFEEEETPDIDEREPIHYRILDATVSFGINYRDTKHEFDDLARMLTSALAFHKAGGGRPGSGRLGVFAT